MTATITRAEYACPRCRYEFSGPLPAESRLAIGRPVYCPRCYDVARFVGRPDFVTGCPVCEAAR